MKFYVGVTDNKWFAYLAQLQPDEVNFWQPGGNVSFKAIDQYALFFSSCTAQIITLLAEVSLSVIRSCRFLWLGRVFNKEWSSRLFDV